MAVKLPPDTWINQRFFGTKTEDTVYSKIDGSIVGIVKDGKFIQTVDKLPKVEPKKKKQQDKKFAEKMAEINALNSLPQMEQDANFYRSQAENIDISESERNAARAEYNSLKLQIESAQKAARVSGSQVQETKKKEISLDAKEKAAKMKGEYKRLQDQYDALIDPEDPAGNGPNILKKIDTLAKDYADVYRQVVGAQVSDAVAKLNLTGKQLPTMGYSIPAGIDPTSYQAKKAAEAQAAQGTKTDQTPKANTPTAGTSGVSGQTPKAPEKKIPGKTASALKDEALSVAATDLSLPEVLFNRVPSLKNLLERYVSEKWTADKLRKEIRNDTWYKQNSAEIKTRFVQKYNYDDLVATGQAKGTTDYEMKIAQIEKSLSARAAQLGSGAASDPAALRKAAENLYITNRSEDQSYITDFLAASIRPTTSMIGGKLTEGYSGQALLDYQNLQSIAKNNGFKLSDIIPGAQTEQQVLAGIANGTIDANRIAQDARKLAAQGQPTYVRDLLGQGYDLSQVYAPYKQTMASILELNSDQIDLNDPTLRMGITDKGDMNLYDFQKMLRQDSRWQYTGNAKESVSTSALQVLRDFGFQG